MALTLTFDQTGAGIPAGQVDRARTDIVSTGPVGTRAYPVQITIGSVPVGATADLALLDEAPGSNPLLEQVDATHWTLTFDKDCWGPFRVRSRANRDGQVLESVVRRISIRSPRRGMHYPALSERTDPGATSVPTVPSVALTEMNEGSTNRSRVDYDRAVVEEIERIDQLAFEEIADHGAQHASNGSDPIPAATSVVGGGMSAADKSKLDGIASNINSQAATAQATAVAAGAAASAAASAATTAQSTANTAVANAATAQSTANTAVTNAATAQATADAAVPKSTYDANSIVKADSDNTPIVLVVPASAFVGRKASGGIVAMTPAEAAALLGDLVPNSLFDANSLLVANVDDTPLALSVAASRIVGRKSTGNIAALTAAEVGRILGTDNPYLSAPNTPHADDREVVDSADLINDWGLSIWNADDGVAVTSRAGEVDPRSQHTTITTYRSTMKNGRIFFQGPGPNKTCLIYKSLSAVTDGTVLWARVGGQAQNAAGPTTSSLGAIGIFASNSSGGAPTLNSGNRMSVLANSDGVDTKLQFRVRIAGSPTTADGKALNMTPPDLVGLYVSGGNTQVLPFWKDSRTGAEWIGASLQQTPGSTWMTSLDKFGFHAFSGVAGALNFGVVELGFLRRCASWPGIY